MNVMNLNVKFFVKSNCTKSQFINFPKVPTRKKINRIKNLKKEFHSQLLVQMLFCKLMIKESEPVSTHGVLQKLRTKNIAILRYYEICLYELICRIYKMLLPSVITK